MIHLIFAVLNALNCYKYSSSSFICKMTEVSCSLNFEFVPADFVLVIARYYH